METAIDLCNLCNTMYDLLERTPKMLYCSHYFCLLCVHSMKKEDCILCITCGFRTPAPRDLGWLPTQTDAVLRIPNAQHQYIGFDLVDELRRIPGRCPIWSGRNDLGRDQYSRTNVNGFGMERNSHGYSLSAYYGPSVEGGDASRCTKGCSINTHKTFDSKGTPQGMSSSSRSHPFIIDFGDAWSANKSTNYAGVELRRNVSTETSQLSDGNRLYNTFVEWGRSLSEERSEPSRREWQNWELLGGLSWSERDGTKANEVCSLPQCSFRNPTNMSDWNRGNELYWKAQELEALLKKLSNATSNSNRDGRLISAGYLREIVNMILLDFPIEDSDMRLLEFMINPRRLPSHQTTLQPCNSNLGLDTFSEKNISSKLYAILYIGATLVNKWYQRFYAEIGSSTPVFKKGHFGAPGDELMSYVLKGNLGEIQRGLRSNGSLTSRRSVVNSQTQTDLPHAKEESVNEDMDENRDRPAMALVPYKFGNNYFMDFTIGDKLAGRVIIEIFPSTTPLMSANFAALCLGTGGMSYKGCSVFQTWRNESIITGDIVTNTGYGGRSAMHEEFFLPDRSKLPAERGMVGMRKLAKTPESQRGKVSSQFRILLNKQPNITGIFGRVLSGIEVIDRISRLDDRRGNPRKKVFITDCGKLPIC